AAFTSSHSDARRTLGITLAALACAALLLGILLSLSRMGMLSCVASVLAAAGLTLYFSPLRRSAKWIFTAAAAAVILASFAFIVPERLVARFNDISVTGDQTEGRLGVWKDTLSLIADYPLAGCGMGAFESGFRKYKTSGFGFL